jgi:hypothetical protein
MQIWSRIHFGKPDSHIDFEAGVAAFCRIALLKGRASQYELKDLQDFAIRTIDFDHHQRFYKASK